MIQITGDVRIIVYGCLGVCTEEEIRFGGGNSSSGLIEICLNSAWKELCDDSRYGFYTTFICVDNWETALSVKVELLMIYYTPNSVSRAQLF